MRTFLIYTFVLVFFPAVAEEDAQAPVRKPEGESYVKQYAAEAIRQMEYSGIPASITLAQGMLESGNGLSELAVKSNNHFGIKCHGWSGKKTFHDDDKKGECFRVYDEVLESYKDHSEFLMHRSRYAFLFDIKDKDYKKWAKGLKKAGYATNPKYADILIKKIEDYQLWKYDVMSSAELQVGEEVAMMEPHKVQFKGVEYNIVRSHTVKITESKIRYVVAHKGDTYVRIAQEFNMSLWQLYAFNDMNGEDHLREGDIIYLQPKLKKYKGDSDVVFAKDETLAQLSQRLGIQLKYLLKVNPGLKATDFLHRGQKVKLKA